MNNLAGKTLWVMRHGRPNVPPNPFLMTGAEFNGYLAQYDAAGLSPHERDRLRALYQGFPKPDLVVSSDLPRARETAELFGRGAPMVIDPLFREIPIMVPTAPTWFLGRRWPSQVWWRYLRAAWFFNNPPEGFRLSTARSLQAIAAIRDRQVGVDRLAVVSHSGFLLVVVNQMMRQGLLRGRRLPHIDFGRPTEYTWR